MERHMAQQRMRSSDSLAGHSSDGDFITPRDRGYHSAGTPRDDRFYTPRASARVGGSSSDGEWG
eukprot:CAMPEP_0182590324 /NCGR_PEP_ID=MMETSP1324-20130603/71489_1 /TAXON_ID=236786 /ORGANISM="Florenciella sp., Strain RCC1587" /LENGTH=63 /DNA_ID=CAMNT_0024807539 /DNA_START=48 /DNA_END=236 /DNA_ORIENTATION=-